MHSTDERLDRLRAALRVLLSDRLERLARTLQDPLPSVTVGLWFPACPMVLAGYGPPMFGDPPELGLARAWDEFAAPAPRPLGLGRLPRVARTEDVLQLRELTLNELARRAVSHNTRQTLNATARIDERLPARTIRITRAGESLILRATDA
jgi:hypothetical protein